MKLQTKFLTVDDDLETIVNDINEAQWGEDNEIEIYEVAALRAYLLQQDTLFVTCYKGENESMNLGGIASARVLHKPYKKLPWLYIDEVDTAINLRKQGIGSALMKTLLEYADEQDLDEVWLGTEFDNTSANKLYESLSPDSIDQVIGYTFDLD